MRCERTYHCTHKIALQYTLHDIAPSLSELTEVCEKENNPYNADFYTKDALLDSPSKCTQFVAAHTAMCTNYTRTNVSVEDILQQVVSELESKKSYTNHGQPERIKITYFTNRLVSSAE